MKKIVLALTLVSSFCASAKECGSYLTKRNTEIVICANKEGNSLTNIEASTSIETDGYFLKNSSFNANAACKAFRYRSASDKSRINVGNDAWFYNIRGNMIEQRYSAFKLQALGKVECK